MDAREWALVIFTIFMQMAVGTFIVLGVVHFFAARKYGEQEADHLSDRALLAVVPLLALGMLASLLHLGNPMKAPTAVINLATSWLSREVFLTVIFFVISAVFAFMQWRKISQPSTRNVIAWIATLVGVLAIYAMSRIYMIAAQPAWNTWATPVFFFASAFLLGALAVGAAYVANYAYLQKKEAEGSDVQLDILANTLRWVAVAAVVLLGVQLVAYPLYMAYLSGSGGAGASTARLIAGEFAVPFALRLILAFIGAGLLAVFLFYTATAYKKASVLTTLAYWAFVLVLVAEVLGRYVFYASHVNIGV